MGCCFGVCKVGDKVSFVPLIQIDKMDAIPKQGKRGCSYCPLNEVKGIKKVPGKVRGRKIFIWAQSPGHQENKNKKELLGPAGKLLWKALKKVGIYREDCDIQNVVRCLPADYNPNVYPSLKMRTPSKEEIKCCSVYTEQAIEHSKAKIHLIFGAIAHKAVLGREYRKDKRIFFSEYLKAWVVCLDHPAYFIRQGYTHENLSTNQQSDSLKRFKNDLHYASQLLKNKSTDQFAFIKKLDIKAITNIKDAKKAYKDLKRDGEDGFTLVFDTEEGKVDKHGRPDDAGEYIDLCVGMITNKTAYVFFTNHPDAHLHRRVKRFNRKCIQKLMLNPRIQKAAHYACHDADSVNKFQGVQVTELNYDTLLAEFFRDPNTKAYGIENIAIRRYPDWVGYKNIRFPEAFTKDYAAKVAKAKATNAQKIDKADKTGKINLARLPLKKLTLYNGADCHFEKMLEKKTQKFVNPPLMRTYVDSSHILYRMQHDKECKPQYDYRWDKEFSPIFRRRHKLQKKALLKIAGKRIKMKKKGKWVKKKFNPNSPEQIVWLLYKKLRIKPILDKKGNVADNTKAGTLKILGAKYPAARAVVDYRETGKARTMIKSYRNCANLNDGVLSTIWKQTGTSTGRLSSGKTKERSDDNVINMQNIHGDLFIKNLFVSDTRWWDIYEYWLAHGDFDKRSWRRFRNYNVMLGNDFSQNELRQLAEESGDKNLIAAFTTDKMWYCKQCKKEHPADPHVEVGHALTGWAREEIAHNDRVRKLVKNMQFGLVYGLQGEGLYQFLLALGVKTTRKEVDKYHALYFKTYPGVKRLQHHYRSFVEKHHYVVNAFGFRRKLNVNATEEERAGSGWWGNQAINTPIQGAAHQYLLMALAMLHRKPKKYSLLQKVMMEIHDALYNRVKLKNLMKAVPLSHYLMVKEPKHVVEREFKKKKLVSLHSKPKAGFRFGVQLEGVGNGELATEWGFLNAWCRENQKMMKALAWCQKHTETHDSYLDYLKSKEN